MAVRVRHAPVVLGRWLWPQGPGGLGWALVRTLATLITVGTAAWLGLSQLLTRRWPWDVAGTGPSQSDIFKLALAVVATVGGAIALVVNFRRQRHLELDAAGRRDELRLFTERFGAAAAQLGGDQAPVRLAGVYAMAALADEWTDRRQQCIEVLCGYLRLPYVGEPPPGHPELVIEQRQYNAGAVQRTETTRHRTGEAQVRRAIVATIAQHLQPDARPGWSDQDFDLTGAALTDASFTSAVFSGEALFTGATFLGARTSFEEVAFSGRRTSFDRATFRGEDISFDRARFSGADTSFSGAAFCGDYTSFNNATFSGRRTSFDRATFVRALDGVDRVEAAMRRARFIHPDRVTWGPVPPRSAHGPDHKMGPSDRAGRKRRYT